MLTDAQKETLKTSIETATDQPTIDARTIGDTQKLADLYNVEANPTFYVWRSSLTSGQAREAISGGDGLSQLDNLTAGKRDSLLWVFNDTTYPTNAAQRNAIEGLCGTQNTLKAAIAAAQKRKLSRAERLYASGTGSEASPGNVAWEGTLSWQDIAAALYA